MATEIDRLMVTLDANITAMSAKLDQAIAKNKAAAKQIDDAWGTPGSGLAAAQKGFDSLADHIADAAKSIPGLGAALTALGPAGLVAAAAIGTFLAVVKGAQDSIEFAAGIAEVAEKLGISTEALQQYQFAVIATGGTIEDANGTLTDFTKMLGLAELGSNRAAKAFEALHLDPKTLVGEGTMQALVDVVNALAQVPNQAERMALASRVGLGSVVELANEGVGALQTLMQTAQDAGLTLGPGIGEQAKVAKVELEAISSVVKNELTTAFVHLAPSIITVAEYIAAATLAVIDLAEGFVTAGVAIQNSIGNWGIKLDDMSKKLIAMVPWLQVVQDVLNQSNSNWSKAGAQAGAAEYNSAEKTLGGVKSPAISALEAAAQKAAADLTGVPAKLNSLFAQLHLDGKSGGGPPPGSLAKTKAAPTDTTQKTLDEIAGVLAGATRNLLTAELGLTTNLDARSDIEKKIAQQELAQQLEELKKKADAAAKDKGLDGPQHDATIKAINADLAKAAAADKAAELDKEKLIADQTLVAKIEQQSAQYDADIQRHAAVEQAESDHLTALAGLSDVASERNQFERRALAIAQQRESELADAQLKDAQAHLNAALAVTNPDPAKVALAQTEVGSAQDKIAGLNQKHADAVAAQLKQQEDPVQKYADSLKDLNTLMMDDGVEAAKSLADGLADALVNAKSFGDAVSSVFRNLLQQILSQMLQQQITAPLLGALTSVLNPVSALSNGVSTLDATMIKPAGFFAAIKPAFLAAGSDYTPAGLAVVGEQGPELVQMPGGARVIPNGALRNIGMGAATPTGPTIIMDNRGAVIWEQAAKQLMAYADRAAATAGVTSAQFSRAATPSDLSRLASRKLG